MYVFIVTNFYNVRFISDDGEPELQPAVRDQRRRLHQLREPDRPRSVAQPGGPLLPHRKPLAMGRGEQKLRYPKESTSI